MKEYNFKVKKEDSGKRVDKYIFDKTGNDFSRTFIQKLIKKGDIKLQQHEIKSHYKVKQGDSIKISLSSPRESSFKPIACDLDIIYEDSHIIVVNKPAGMVVHPIKKYEGKRTTLVNALLHHCNDLSHIGGVLKPGIVHRLDKETSGVIIAAKSDFAHRSLAKQFKKRDIKKVYVALVKGKMKVKEGTVDLPIGRSAAKRTNMKISYVDGRDAFTKYKLIRRFDGYSLVKIFPKTGRTHQIRVHLSYLGYPVLGDKRYGRDNKLLDRHALHAYQITIKHPKSKKNQIFTCPIPKDMREFIGRDLIDKQGYLL